MKKFTGILFGSFLLSATVFAGGIVTNTNQSAAWARYFSRYATTDIDAVYFNPAGLGKLEQGFHFSINNQSIFQTQTITNDFPYLKYGPEYIGDVKAPLFPSIYGAFKTGKFTISLGFNPIGGGGGATFNNGLPSFELMSGVQLVSSLNAQGIPTTQYSSNTYFEGTSIYWGIQAGLTYEINDMFSIFAGARYVSALNTYSGSLTDLMIDPYAPPINDGSMIRADQFFTTAADTYGQISSGSLAAYTDLKNGIDDGSLNPGDPLDNQGYIDFLTALGIYKDGMKNYEAAGTFLIASYVTKEKSDEAAATATLVTDQGVEVKQTGSGVTPIVGAHVSLGENIDIAVKYEFKTKLELTNQTTKDFLMGYDSVGNPITMFPDGGKTNADMPALLSGGINFRLLKGLQLSAGFEYYWDKNVNWDGREKLINSNSYNVNFSAGYNFGKFMISAAYNYANIGVSQDYQSDLSYSLNSSSIGFGGAWNITENVRLNAGYTMVMYQDESVPYGSDPVVFTQSYAKDTKIFAIGIDFSF
jgi:long-subunit fatty acid transport protein